MTTNQNPTPSIRSQFESMTPQARRQAFVLRDNVTGRYQPRLLTFTEAKAEASTLDSIERADEVLA